MNEIERIIENCRCGNEITSHGSWLIACHERIDRGEIVNISHEDINLWGVDELLKRGAIIARELA